MKSSIHRPRSSCRGRGNRAGWETRTALLLLAFTITSCSVIVDPQQPDFLDYGSRCSENSQCASGVCHFQRCSEECTSSCSGSAECSDGLCQFLSPPPLDGAPSVGFLINGEVASHGLARAHAESRSDVEDDVEDATTMLAEEVTSTSAGSTLTGFIDDGANIIIGTHPELRNAINNSALNNSEKNYLLFGTYADFEPAPNFGSYFGRMYQVSYLMGNLAARVTETGRIGVVAPRATPFSVRNVNAYALGAQLEDSGIEVVVRWIGVWSHNSLEGQAVDELIQADCDIIYGLTDTTRPLEAVAGEQTPSGNDVYAIGYGDANACELVSNRCISSAYWNLGPMLTELVEQMVTGEWLPAEIWGQISGNRDESPVYFSDINPSIAGSSAPLAVETLAAELTQDTNSARMRPFRGPVRDTANELRISSNNYPSDDDLKGMCWHVRGVYEIGEGDPPTLEHAEVPSDCREVR